MRITAFSFHVSNFFRLSCFLSVFLFATPLNAKTVRLLMIGNSFSQNAVKVLPDLAKAGGHELSAEVVYLPGGTLQQHWEKWLAWKSNEHSPKAKYATGRTLEDYLTNQKWDLITFQQGSHLSHDSNSYFPYLSELHDLVRKRVPGAALAIHETWAYREDHKSLSNWGFGPAEMHRRLSNAYTFAAAKLRLPLIRTGDAFAVAENHPSWPRRNDPSFNAESAVFPSLPADSHSLYAGWVWRIAKESPKLVFDVQHAGVAGCFLAACLLYEFLLNENVENISYMPPAPKDPAGNILAANSVLDETDLKFLKSVAHGVGKKQR